MSLTPECLAQLKLRQQPFDDMPSEEFLYSDPLLESLAETAARALAAPGAIVILAGAEGSGRSIQLMRLLGALADNYELIAFRGRPNITFDAVDVTIRNHLGAAGVDSLTPDLGELLARRSRDGEPLVLALDDANLLGMEIVRQLLRLRSEVLEAKGHGLRLIMVGDQALSRGRLPLPDQADESQVVRLNLRPFNLEQAGAYLRHRLRVAGVDEPEVFLTSGDIAALQTSSKGLPALLNANANAWLARRCRSAGGTRQVSQPLVGDLVTPSARPIIAEPPKRSPLTARPPEPYPAASDEPPPGILELDRGDDVYGDDEFVHSRRPDHQLASYLVEEDAAPSQADFEQVLRHIRNGQLVQDSPGAQPESSVPEQAPGESVSAPTPFWSRRWFIPGLILLVMVAILVPVFLQMPTRPDWLAERPTGVATNGAVETAEPSGFKPPPPAPSPDNAGQGKSDDAREGASKAPEKPAEAARAGEATVTPAANGQPPSAEQPKTTSADTSPAMTSKTSAEAVQSPQPPPVEKPRPQPVAVGDLESDRAWLAEQDPGAFTVQLSVVSDAADAKAFIERHALTQARVVQTRARTVVVHGVFADQSAAQRSISSLPAAVRANGPWVRTMGSLRGAKR